MSFAPLVPTTIDVDISTLRTPNERPAREQKVTATHRKHYKPIKGGELRGCEPCPLNKVKGIQKILGTIHGRKILVFAQSPGPEENKLGLELVGPAGKWWWKELSRVGVTRDDVDIQNSQRCFPADRIKGTYETHLKMRDPSKEEMRCCSLHTENFLAQSKAKFILVLGALAAKALLKTRSLPSTKIF